jgi:hypothetical protein
LSRLSDAEAVAALAGTDAQNTTNGVAFSLVFDKRKTAKVRAQRNEELSQFFQAIVDSDGSISETNAETFLVYLDEHGYVDEQGVVQGADLPQHVVSTFALGIGKWRQVS